MATLQSVEAKMLEALSELRTLIEATPAPPQQAQVVLSLEWTDAAGQAHKHVISTTALGDLSQIVA